MTNEQYLALEFLIKTKEFSRKDAQAIDYCLANNSYALNGSGWDSLIEWIENAYPSSSGIT
jgi:hypothetical protein